MKDRLIIAKVDASEHRTLGGRFDVKGFPTIKWFPAGTTAPVDYAGGRSLEDFVKFIKDKTGTCVPPLGPCLCNQQELTHN